MARDPERLRQQRRHGESRRRLRRRLETEGVPSDEIEARVAELREQQLERRIDSTWERITPDDAGYKPSTADPLLRGPARTTTRTAKAAKRAKATTRFELERQETW